MRQLVTPSPLPGRPPRRPQVELIEATTSVVAGAFFESFRLLALNTRRAIAGEPRRVIVVISAHPGDGRSLCSASLAQALSALMPPVVLVDADPLGAGLSDLRLYSAQAFDAITRSTTSVQFDEPVPPLQVFQPAHRLDHAALIEEVESAVSTSVAEQATVIIDSPPCTISSLGFHLASIATGVIYVARRRAQDGAIHREIRGQLNRLGTRIIGVVFNEG